MTRMWLLVLLWVCAAVAQTTVTGTMALPTSGDLVNGSCTYQAASSFDADERQVIQAPVTVVFGQPRFARGHLEVVLTPTNTSTYFNVTCTAPSQTVNGHTTQAYTWKWTWQVLTSGTPVSINDVIVSGPPAPSTLIGLSQINPSGASPRQTICATGTGWAVGNCGGSGLGYYLVTVNGASTTVTAPTHGLGVHVWLDACNASDGTGFEPGAWSVDGSGTVTILGLSDMSGTCKLLGSPSGAGFYQATVTGSSASIPATQHGLVSPTVVACLDATGNAYVFGPWSRDAFGLVTIRGTTTGSCILQ